MVKKIQVGLILLACMRCGWALDLADYELVDLTHPYNEDTIYWPTSPSTFKKETLSEGDTPGGWYYSAYAVCTPEHGGTHLDAPVHFDADGVRHGTKTMAL
jgi:kynurenine formamidase